MNVKTQMSVHVKGELYSFGHYSIVSNKASEKAIRRALNNVIYQKYMQLCKNLA